MIVVTGPTGQIGHHTVANLIADGQSLRLIARDPSKLSDEVRARAEIVQGSHGDADVVERAFEGADALFWVAPPNPQKTMDEVYLDFTRPAAQAIARFGIKRVVAVTALGRGTPWQDHAGLVTASIAMDAMLMATGAGFRGLAMPSFMDNMLRQAQAIREHDRFFGTLDPDRKMPTTATRDMGAVAARLLADASWTGQQEVPVLGPADLSANEMAEIMSQVLGRRIAYSHTSFEDFEAQQIARGASESFARGYGDMFRAKNEGMDNVADVACAMRTPTSFRQWCEETLKPAVVA